MMPSVKTLVSALVTLAVALVSAQQTDQQYAPSNSLASTNALVDSDAAEALCKSLATTFKTDKFEINNTFAQYFPEGSNPSIELLAKLYPNGTIPKGVSLPKIFDTLSPDADIKSDAGYGKSSTRASKNGPMGGLPAFCRFGAFIKTSELTIVLSEVWMPLAEDRSRPLAPVNDTDFPQNTTSYLIGADGSFMRVPLYVAKNMTDDPPKPQPGAMKPTAPNDYPDPAAQKKNATMKAGMPGETKPDDTKPDGTKPEETKPDSTTTGKPDSTTSAAPPMKRMMPKRSEKHHHHHHRQHADAIPGDTVLGEGDAWNGRLIVQGNGAQRGFVPFPDMKLLMSRYRFAVAGTNLGHFSAGSGVIWVNGTQFNETLTDFGYRANHVTLQLAEQVIDAFYGANAGKRDPKDHRIQRYYTGSSVGSARGLSAMSAYPTDYHGLLLGPPAANFINLNIGQLHISAVHNKTVVGDGFFTQGALYGPIKEIVYEQCDKLDGVRDGVIADPFKCKPNITEDIICGGQGRFSKSNATCLTQKQIAAFEELYKPTLLDGTQVYPEYLHGSEISASSMTAINGKANGWTQLVVYKQKMLNSSFNPFTDIHFKDVDAANKENVGRVNAQEVDYSEFVKAGGKMLMFQGLADLVVSPKNTINLYEDILKNTKGAKDVAKLYLIGGMKHSRQGPGAWNFGSPSQTDAGSRPLHFTTKYDAMLALLSWVEGHNGQKGKLPETLVGAAYTQRSSIFPERAGSSDGGPDTDLPIPSALQDYNWGLQFTRPLCAYPKMLTYKGGDPTGAQGYQSFSCE